MNHKVHLLLATFIFFLTSCSQHDHTHEPAAGMTDPALDEHEEELVLTSEQMHNIGIQYDQVTPRSLRSTVRINGRVELPPDGKAVSTTPLAGQIANIHIQEGQFVTKGHPLFTVTNLELIDWQESYLKSAAELEYLEQEIARQKYLSDEQLAPVKTLQSLEAEKKKTSIAMEAVRGRLAVVGLVPGDKSPMKRTFTISAPQSGVIQHIQVHKGSYVDAHNELVEIINNRHLRIHLFAYGNDMEYLKEGLKIEFFVQSRPGEIRQAEIVWINNLVNEENNSYEIHADISGDLKSLSPGEFVEARVINKEQWLPSLPLIAITFDKGLTYIFVKEEDHNEESHFAKIQIKTGESDLGYIEVSPIDPIPNDAYVVTEGSFFLMAQSKKGEEGGGHHH